MYHLIVGYGGPDDLKGPVDVDKSRYLEYTASENQTRYRELTPQAVKELRQYPALLMREGIDSEACVVKIENIQGVGRSYRVSISPISGLERINGGVIQALALDLEIDSFEFHRHHWAIKDVDLLQTLSERQAAREDTIAPAVQVIQGGDAPDNMPVADGARFNKEQVFIVHGHDEHAKNDAKAYVEELGKQPIILHLQASQGRTIIEKIDHYSNVGFAIVLYTECDMGAKRNTLTFKWRARQNVVFEHGYLIGKLGRSRVVALVKGDVEAPNDISGVVYITMDNAGTWKAELAKELAAAGYEVTPNVFGGQQSAPANGASPSR
ncbi:MAG: nucleotide-binding protein [Planctomycetia bacterium]|nr:nucleotide-binding protein [Planctomycetia bacterium]